VKHSPLIRRTALARGGKLRPFSAKRRKRIPARRACREAVYARAGGRCEVRGPTCSGAGEQVHERLTRARGGDATDPANCLLVCANCHRDIHLFVAWAEKRGFLKSQHGEEGRAK
jgi:hypothetical protein